MRWLWPFFFSLFPRQFSYLAPLYIPTLSFPSPVEANDRAVHSERLKYDSMRHDLDARVRDLAMTVEQKDMDRLKMTAELENRYEHKLAEQIDRYDLLSEDMELLRQKCKGAHG